MRSCGKYAFTYDYVSLHAVVQLTRRAPSVPPSLPPGCRHRPASRFLWTVSSAPTATTVANRFYVVSADVAAYLYLHAPHSDVVDTLTRLSQAAVLVTSDDRGRILDAASSLQAVRDALDGRGVRRRRRRSGGSSKFESPCAKFAFLGGIENLTDLTTLADADRKAALSAKDFRELVPPLPLAPLRGTGNAVATTLADTDAGAGADDTGADADAGATDALIALEATLATCPSSLVEEPSAATRTVTGAHSASDGAGDTATCPQYTTRRFRPPGAPDAGPAVLASFPGSGNTYARLLLEAATGYYTGSMYNDLSLMPILPAEGVATNDVVAYKTHLLPRHNHYGKDGYLYPRPGSLHTKPQRTVLLVRHPVRAIWAEFQRRLAQQTTGSGGHVASLSARSLTPKLVAEVFVPWSTCSACRWSQVSASGRCPT